MTATEITPGTYTIQLAGLSGAEFRDAVDIAKAASGVFDAKSKIWTVTVTEPRTTAYICGPCGGIGRVAVPGTDWCMLASGPKNRICTVSGQHSHSAAACDRCDGTGRIRRVTDSGGVLQVEQLRDRYHAIVERA